ncbi:ligand-binding sensor domain-containing protein/CheY-like chemotaxis protein/AraC-like DNA-binding protein [Pedobacter africanus]|uniref:Ligand-binding sensor domain-containing protein/CheY-like chemotaxis protein/AraC-like DNA-binding protein n=1 Tax=Pedobacter africanus TaxID=151894 RepID=A0ACC6KQC8_9SPHI|nr:two-component regulator propeller domain-containing protein [Pedobacter africanus]MDR6781558.1 ligand-binding sensor domain-containing protein/CheY-like chemotaxis protein/AraC-like DNA-binding protein [Pedobacter africanus]
MSPLFCRNNLLLLAALILGYGVAYGQKSKMSFNHLTVENGLSQSSVLSIAQDSMGFMWFGTKDGLNKYNSRSFEIYKREKGNKSSLSSSQNINALITDRKGNLWVGTQKGLNRYLPEKNAFKRYLHNAKDSSSLSNNIIRSLYEDKKGNIWVGTDSGLNKLGTDGKFQIFLPGKPGLGIAHQLVKAICEDYQGNLWVGTLQGLTKIIQQKGSYRFESYYHKPGDPNSLIDNDISVIFEDPKHNLWVGTHNNGLELFDPKTGIFKHFTARKGLPGSISSNVIRKIKVDQDGRLWVSTLNGINIFNSETRTFTVLNHNPEDPSSLNQNSIYDILKDATGSMWMGTYYGGVNFYHANSTPFKGYKSTSVKNGLSSNVVSSIVEDEKHNLWIGTEAEGLNYYDRATGKFTSFKHDPENPSSLSSNLVKAISIDQKGKVWIGTYEGGLDVYLPGSNSFKHYKPDPSDPKALNSNRIVCLLHDSQDRLWVGTRAHGLFLYNENEDNFSPFTRQSNQQDLKFTRYLFEDSKKNIWIATNSGTYILGPNAKQVRRFTVADNISTFDDINLIQEDIKGTIWLGSYDSGLIRYHPASNKIKFYTTANGLPSNVVLGVLEDHHGYLWISTADGLAKFDKKVFKTFTVQDGLPGNVFNYNSFFKDSKGEFFFGGYNGLVSFFPDQIRENKKVPKVIFTRLRLFNKTVAIGDESNLLSRNISLTKEITFSHSQNIFSFDFAVLNYIKSEKNKYAYKLEGVDKDWNFVTSPTATFNNLPSGTYKLLIKGANNDGVWTDYPEEIIIHVLPPFWKTWWAYLIYGICLSAILFLVFRFLWIRALLRKEHEVYQMKMDFFTNVSHEIRTPLTLIVGPLENLINDTKESPRLNRRLLTVKKNAGRLTRLVNELMDFRKEEAGKMTLNVSPENIVEFAKEIYLSFQYLAIKHHIDYQFKSSEDNIEVYFDHSQLEKVFFNLLSNAFKFTPDYGVIVLSVKRGEKGYVEISVIDNGKGIPEDSRDKIFTNFYQVKDPLSRHSGTGIGLALSRKIARLHHGDLLLLPNQLPGETNIQTCFCLKLKTGSQHFKKDELIPQYVNVESPDLYRLPQEIALEEEPALTEEGIAEERVTLLIVEDNPEIRDFVKASLKPFYHILEAEDGGRGAEIAFEKIPDIIVSDVMMPVMDGLELCRTLKTDPRTSHIPIILLTARSGNIHEVSGLKTGAEAYITKPFSIDVLQLNIKNLLSLQANMRRKFSQQITLQPSNILIESTDEEFLNKIMGIIENNFSVDDFNVNILAAEVGMSTPILYKKIKTLTGLTVNNFIKSVRLKRAAQLLKQDAYTVYEVAYMVGFSDSKYFSKEFVKQFGRTPSDYITEEF